VNKLIAIDPSLTCSGWALFLVERHKLIGVGKLKSLPPTYMLECRLDRLFESVNNLLNDLEFGENDFLICEAPTTMLDPSAVIKVEQVRGVFENSGRSKKVQILGRINPRTIHRELLGMKGSQLSRNVVKASALNLVKMLYSKELGCLGIDLSFEALQKNQDIVDAILIGHLAVLKINSAISIGENHLTYFQTKTKRRLGYKFQALK
jgi:Holliday junction resolvasome RuvABC endonuclease subunit